MIPLNELFGNYKEIEYTLKESNRIKYAAYRTSSKLRAVQKALFMDKVHLKLICRVFETHQLQQTENSIKLNKPELESVLADIYFVVQKENDVFFDMDSILQLMISFLFSVYNSKIANVIQVLSLKIGLTLLCQAKPREKYHYLFSQMADHNNCLSRKRLEILLKKMISLTEYINEGPSFGSELIAGTIESCFQCNIGTLGISEDIFLKWLMQDPQLLVWVSTLYRMQISEAVTHNSTCAICKVYPIVGLRYKCLRCLSYDMCQSCFFTGKFNKKHKLKHPVQEYCYPITSQQSTKAFLLTLINRIYKKNSKMQYLPAVKVEANEIEALGESTRHLDEMDTTSRTIVNGSAISVQKFPYRELQNIIFHLEREGEKLIPQIENLFSTIEKLNGNQCQLQVKNCLLRHKTQVEIQMQRLKLLKNYLLCNGKCDANAFLESTPVVEQVLLNKRKKRFENSFDFSPITRHLPKRAEDTSGKKMMWDNYDLVDGGVEKTWEALKSRSNENNSFDHLQLKELESIAVEGSDSDLSISTWLGGKVIDELNGSTNKGLSWLQENEGEKSDEVENENEETFDKLQADLKEIFKKLQDLSVPTSKEEPEKVDNEEEKMQAAIEVDALLVDLISGIEKLMGG